MLQQAGGCCSKRRDVAAGRGMLQQAGGCCSRPGDLQQAGGIATGRGNCSRSEELEQAGGVVAGRRNCSRPEELQLAAGQGNCRRLREEKEGMCTGGEILQNLLRRGWVTFSNKRHVAENGILIWGGKCGGGLPENISNIGQKYLQHKVAQELLQEKRD
ncbi:hypothetical protein SLEP1_g58392 [Rubroshorea leprosula]|uniref:Uncharacterized protein n=1 Tax=Rubroshorea leprosula TaxID=152421 RepID=A0AAV5MQE5_9ROSI|nr:hypothetical protein SLEP1_g58392 [Rubroshorea leprosula]